MAHRAFASLVKLDSWIAWLRGFAAHESASVFGIAQVKEWPSSEDRSADE